MPTSAITVEELRESVDHWVVGKRAHSTQIVHVPAPTSQPNAPQTACEHRERSTRSGEPWGGWVLKAPAVYPPGYVSLCQDCARIADRNGLAAASDDGSS